MTTPAVVNGKEPFLKRWKLVIALASLAIAGIIAWLVLSNASSGSSISNLALHKTANQSSTLPGSPSEAGLAVDGNSDGDFFHHSVSSTNLGANAWWQVDLGASKAIGFIVISNRTDCCATRLSNYWVFLSDTPFGPKDTPATLQNRAETWKIHQTQAPDPAATIATAGAKGRYVRVQLDGTDYLSLAEVEVWPTGTNLAAGKPATQSSALAGYPSGAGLAVDGNTDGSFFHGSVTSTNPDHQAWWQVDLGATKSIGSVVIWNRTDCCSARLSDYWVFVSDTPFGPKDTPATLQNRAETWKSHRTTAPSPTSVIGTEGAKGRYLRVQLSGTEYLSLAEVQVFGQ